MNYRLEIKDYKDPDESKSETFKSLIDASMRLVELLGEDMFDEHIYDIIEWKRIRVNVPGYGNIEFQMIKV